MVPGIERFDGTTVHFTDGTERDYGTILWATGFRPTLPFLDESLVSRRDGVPLRYAGGIVPAGLEKLYYIGLAAPRGPQIPLYGVQTKLAIRIVELHEAAGDGGAEVGAYLSALQEPERQDRHRPRRLGRRDGGHRAAARRVRDGANESVMRECDSLVRRCRRVRRRR